MSKILDSIISIIEEKNPLHVKKLKENQQRFDQDYFERAELFFADQMILLQRDGKDLDYAVDCYLRMLGDFVFEQINFYRSGKYSNDSFDAVNKAFYSNPEIAEYYMHGLLLSQFLWLHHYKIYSFFIENLNTYSKRTSSYLEIGGGHGLYTKEALNTLNPDTLIDLVDISQSSINLAKSFINSPGVNYHLSDIFDYDPGNKYDFISMCELIEHVEKPLDLLRKMKSLLSPGGTAYITTPTNAPTIDHIYLFNNSEEIRILLSEAGFSIENEIEVPAENVPVEVAHEKKICVMYGAFLKHE